MQKHKNLILLIGLVASIFTTTIATFLPVAAAPVDGSFKWDNDRQISGRISISDGNTFNVTFGGEAPELEATITNATRAGGRGQRTCGDIQATLTMSSATRGTISTSAGDNVCRNSINGAVAVGDAAKAPDDATWGTPPAGGNTDDDSEDEGSACEIDGIGWLICPVVGFFAGIVDSVYKILGNSFLRVVPLSTDTGNDNAIYVVWKAMRNVANIAFIIAFLIIVMSQVTSIGLSNYNIKKMLPRLIIAAILVNISYWLCAVAVDLSNIAGVSSKDLFTSAVNIEGFGSSESPWATGSWWSNLTVGVLATASVSLLGISILFPVLIAALAATVTVVVVLLMRQALIVLLIVVSPLAFVAFLLPNTESLFTKWRKLLLTLLLMYPVIGAVFGASQLASRVVMAGAGDSTGGGDQMLPQIMGAAISVIPLFITPIIMKTAGGLLNRFGGIVNNREKGAFDRMRKVASGYREGEMNRRRGNNAKRAATVLESKRGGLGGEGSRRRKALATIASLGTSTRINRDKKRGFEKAVADESEQEYFTGRAINEEGFALKIAGTPRKAEALRARAQSDIDQEEESSVKAREVLYESRYESTESLGELDNTFRAAVRSGDKIGARAAQKVLLNSGTAGLNKLSKALEELEVAPDGGFDQNPELVDSLKKDLNKAGIKGKDNALASWAFTPNLSLEDIRNGATIDSSGNTAYTKLNSRELVGQTAANLEKAMQAGNIDPAVAREILANPTLQGELDKPKREILQRVVQTAPTQVSANIQNQTPASASQTQATTLNVPHDTSAPVPPTAPTTINVQTPTSPAVSAPPTAPTTINVQTPPPAARDNFVQNPSGLFVPRDNDNPPTTPPSQNP